MDSMNHLQFEVSPDIQVGILSGNRQFWPNILPSTEKVSSAFFQILDWLRSYAQLNRHWHAKCREIRRYLWLHCNFGERRNEALAQSHTRMSCKDKHQSALTFALSLDSTC